MKLNNSLVAQNVNNVELVRQTNVILSREIAKMMTEQGNAAIAKEHLLMFKGTGLLFNAETQEYDLFVPSAERTMAMVEEELHTLARLAKDKATKARNDYEDHMKAGVAAMRTIRTSKLVIPYPGMELQNSSGFGAL